MKHIFTNCDTDDYFSTINPITLSLGAPWLVSPQPDLCSPSTSLRCSSASFLVKGFCINEIRSCDFLHHQQYSKTGQSETRLENTYNRALWHERQQHRATSANTAPNPYLACRPPLDVSHNILGKCLRADSKEDLIGLLLDNVLHGQVVGVVGQLEGRQVGQEVCRDATREERDDAHTERRQLHAPGLACLD